MNDRGRRRRILHELLGRRRDKERRVRFTMACMACVAMLSVCAAVMVVSPASAHSSSVAACSAMMRWPVEQARMVGAFDAPDKPWLPGHRGVDLAAVEGAAVVAPADGVVAFAGKVAGKDVVTIRHGDAQGALTSTFEPAVAEKAVGTRVGKGERFAHAEGESDHCDGECLHWGLKTGERDYADPAGKVRPVRIGLKTPR